MQSVLVIDDDPVFRGLLVRELRTLPDLDVHEAAGGGHALRLLGARSFDLITLDLHMPLIDGFMVLRALRTKPGPNERTPIFVITSDLSTPSRTRAMELGVAIYMTKPLVMSAALAILSGRLKQASPRA